MDLYAQNILDRYKAPFHKGKSQSEERRAKSEESEQKSSPLHAHRSTLATHKEANHSCGDVVEVEMELNEERLKQYHFSGAGCAISMAAADMMGDLIVGMTEMEVLALTKEEIYEMLGIEISVRRSKCALLGLLAIQNGLLAYQNKEGKTWKDYHI